MMNVDLIIKLARLANENPNENEANLAARKVCQLLKAANYKFNGAAPTPPPIYKQPAPKTWNDVKRSTEPQWSSNKPPTPDPDYNPFVDFMNEFWTRNDRPFADNYRGSYQPPRQEPPKPKEDARPIAEFNPVTREYKLPTGFTVSEIEFIARNMETQYRVKTKFYEPTKEQESFYNRKAYSPFSQDKPRPEKRMRECIRCNIIKETVYVGNLFICADCQWKEYKSKDAEQV